MSAPFRGVPEDSTGSGVPLHVVVGRSDEAAVVLTSLEVWPAGMFLVLNCVVRRYPPTAPLAVAWSARPAHADRLHVTLRVPGRQAVPAAASHVGERGAQASLSLRIEGPVQHGRLLRLRLWCEPLPVEQQVAIVVRWPAYGIDESGFTLDPEVLAAAASRSLPLWPGSLPKGGSPTPRPEGRPSGGSAGSALGVPPDDRVPGNRWQ